MLAVPTCFPAACVLGALLCLSFGAYCSRRRVWDKWFPGHTKPGVITYKKAGEYGESEGHPYLYSPFKEPLNAWSSLAYSFFGVVILCCGLVDEGNAVADNVLHATPVFSVLYGLSCVYLGVASCLFHASHSEPWRKADAGMTTGVMVAPLVLAIWDRARPPAASAPLAAVLAVTLQVSLTHGHVPYGSSDILLPLLVALCWLLELLPRYQGAVEWAGESCLWLRCFYGALGGMLLRLADVKRKDKAFYTNAVRGFFVVTAGFAWALPDGLLDPIILCGLVAGAVVAGHSPSSGHVFWHLGSSYALFAWWLLYRTRPGDPPEPYSNDREAIVLALLIATKNAFRRLGMMLPVPALLALLAHVPGLGALGTWGKGGAGAGAGPSATAEDIQRRLECLVEHTFFALWAYQVIVLDPASTGTGTGTATASTESAVFGSSRRLSEEASSSSSSSSSWLYNSRLLWVEPAFPSEAFHLYYAAKVATHTEDLLYLAVVAYQRWQASRAAPTSASSGGSSGGGSSSGTGSGGGGAEEEKMLLQSAAAALHQSESGLPGTTPANASAVVIGAEKRVQQGEAGEAGGSARASDVTMTLHHIATAALCLQSYVLGYVRVGSVIMFLHDVSDVPLDVVRLLGALRLTHPVPMAAAFVCLVVSWAYWRLWFFPSVVLYSVAVESKSLILTTEGCDIGHCSLAQVPERVPFLALLGVLLLLHVVWFVAIVRKGYAELVIGRKVPVGV